MSRKGYRLNWKGSEVIAQTEEELCEILGDFGLAAEGESKKELHKGHGVITGTLRRSIHIAEPGYTFSSDDKGGEGEDRAFPEMGGKRIKGKKIGSQFVVLLGSGLSYAMAIHQGWNWQKGGLVGVFAGYHYLTNGVEKAKKDLEQIISWRKSKK